jgi:hypothetical protein
MHRGRRVSAPDELRLQQFGFSAHLRDPGHVPAPPGLEDRRLAIYRELVFANLDSLLAGAFPVARRLLGDDAWVALVRAFLRDHRASTPLFPELPAEFVHYVQVRAEADFDDPPWLAELAHYEYAEVALDFAEAEPLPRAPAGFDPLATPLRVSPLAWPLAYAWPVHRLGPQFMPDELPLQATCLLLLRDGDGKVRFHELGAVALRLLERIGEVPRDTGAAHLLALATEARSEDPEAFVAQATPLLRHFVDLGALGPHGD